MFEDPISLSIQSLYRMRAINNGLKYDTAFAFICIHLP